MPSKIVLGYRQLIDNANAAIRTVKPDEAVAMAAEASVTFLDLRDPREITREGKIPGAFHCPRGMLEFWIDPESPYANPIFQEDRTFVFYCASGWRSALATKMAQDMGLAPVAHIEGGFTAWRKTGGEVEKTESNS
ncbi:MAG: rhodanese-like domain-containing protein [Rhizobiales bacterium]|nr:rhodanese-like domain-containing protein [Hyphomicrobiales bacterium]